MSVKDVMIHFIVQVLASQRVYFPRLEKNTMEPLRHVVIDYVKTHVNLKVGGSEDYKQLSWAIHK